MTPRSPEADRKNPARPPWRAGAVFAAGVLSLGCGPPEGARERTPERAPASTASAALQVATASPELDRLRALAREELAQPDAQDAPRTRAYLESLPPDVRRGVARAIAADSDARLGSLGIDRLMTDGFEDDAVPALARRVVAGDDLTAFGYVWAHGEDESRPLRMYAKIGRHLLARLDGYGPAERVHVERFLIDGGFAGSLPAFSRRAVEERLGRIEALAERRKPK